MTRMISLIFVSIALTACSLTGKNTLYLFEADTSQARVSTNVRSIEIRDVNLPDYASAQEIMVLSEDGKIVSGGKNLWADTPPRAIAAALGRNLSEITGAVTASEPWPLAQYPDIRLVVRVDQMIADASEGFRMSGQYFITPDGRNFRERAVRFSINEPIVGDDYAAYADAASRVVLALSEQIAAQIAN